MTWRDPDLSALPPGQRRAMEALLHPDVPTYEQAARMAGIGIGTLRTHLLRVRQHHRALYGRILGVRKRRMALDPLGRWSDQRLAKALLHARRRLAMRA